MSTTNQTTGNNTTTLGFNPGAQSLYNSLIGGAGGVLGQYINSPLNNPTYNLGAAQSQAGAQQAGQNNMNALNQSALTNGLTGQAGAGFMSAQKAQTGRANQAMSSQANIQNVMAALQRQMAAAGTGLSFSPQLTGQTGSNAGTSSLGGLGTYAPEIGGILSSIIMAANQGSQAGNLFNGGSVGNVLNPSLGTPSYMPGGGPGPTAPYSPTMGMPSMAGTNPSILSSLFAGGGSGAPSPFLSMMNPQ
jgi:hypothetical protein